MFAVILDVFVKITPIPYKLVVLDCCFAVILGEINIILCCNNIGLQQSNPKGEKQMYGKTRFWNRPTEQELEIAQELIDSMESDEERETRLSHPDSCECEAYCKNIIDAENN